MATPLVSVTVRTEGLKPLADPALIQNASKAIIQAALDVFVPLARGQAPSRTGRLREHIRGILDRQGDSWIGRVRPMGRGFYGRFIAAGTKPAKVQPIVPRRGRGGKVAKRQEWVTQAGTVVTTRQRGGFVALKLNVPGGPIFRRSVRHVGLRANPFLERAATAGAEAVETAADRVVQAALNAAK